MGSKAPGGMDGTIEQGQTEIQEVLKYAQNHDFMFEEETLVMYAFLTLHLKNQSDQAWNIIRNSRLNPSTNPLACFALANVAMRTGRNDEAIHILENRPLGTDFHRFHYLELMLGFAKLYQLSPDADFYIEKYINEYRGQNYLKEAYQKLAWHYLIHGNKAAYKNNMRYCQIRGATIIDGDKTALKEANTGNIPNTILLKARLLFDGGYYQQAYDLLSQKTIFDFDDEVFQLEFTYRLGRITHRMNELEKALNFYQQTIDKGQNEEYFFACNAALQMGSIYEKMHNYSQAERYYNLCLSLSPHEYKTGLHQKAKAGKNRIKVNLK